MTSLPFRLSMAAMALLAASVAAAQPASSRTISRTVRPFVSVDAPLVALTNVRVIDGTGARARTGQTVVIEGERIRAVGPAASTPVPAGAQVIDLTGHTVMPGLVGLHNHLYYSSPMGSMRPMMTSYPKLFLGTGLTTIRTTGASDPYQELNLRAAIERGDVAGPDIFVTGPYLQGPQGMGVMHPLDGPDDARRLVRYWAEEGVKWFKAYTTISRAALAAAIDEAHKHAVKVTAHLCSVGFREAVEAGIDNLEHGYLTNSEWYPRKVADQCPAVGDSAVFAAADPRSPDVQRTIDLMVRRGVPMTSTLAVFELSSPSRVPVDQRVLDALHPDAARNVAAFHEGARTATDTVARRLLRQSMDFERAFVRAGGLLAAGSDPCCISAIAGYADHRNFELLVEAGFTPEEAVQIMTANGARVLGIGDRVGRVAAGLQADLVVVRGDPTAAGGTIRDVVTVFRQGIGYDSARLIASVKGQIGTR